MNSGDLYSSKNDWWFKGLFLLFVFFFFNAVMEQIQTNPDIMRSQLRAFMHALLKLSTANVEGRW